MAGFGAYLSPKEQTTLRRIALGTLGPDEVREPHAQRLANLGLVREAGGVLIPTRNGLQRLEIEKLAHAKPERQRRLKRRKLPL